jgi:hypothetical protein
LLVTACSEEALMINVDSMSDDPSLEVRERRRPLLCRPQS